MQPQTFFSPRFQYTFGPHEPALRIASGQRLKVICPDGDNTLSDGSLLTRDQRQQSDGSPLFEGNPLAGPICVVGTEPTDSLAVDIHAIDIDRRDGATLLAPAHGLLTTDDLCGQCHTKTRENVPQHLYRWQIDGGGRTARISNPLGEDALAVPVRPMIGCIGVCPNWGQSTSSLYAGPFGGNLDLGLLSPGATLLLPIFHSGGLLLLGDLHAAQGAGEIVGGGIEVSGAITITVRRVAGRTLVAPRIVTSDCIFAVATCGSLNDAVRRAYGQLVAWLADDLRLNRWDAYQLVSQAGTLEIGGIAIPSCCTVAAGLRRELLPERQQIELRAWV